jgi:two-component system response regulator TctD
VKRVLIAEDDADTAAAIKATLEERLPINAEHVTNGALVLDHLTAMNPDLVILDVSMPGLNGIDVFDLIRGSARCGQVPVLFLTAAPDRAKETIERSGIRDVMAKPFDLEALTRRVEDLLARAQKAA